VNHNKKHTPLTAEELVKLLDIHANNETDLTELDDFEKEALEGFSAHTSAETAKDLMNEVQSDISKKVTNTAITYSNQKSDSKKYKIIWFSAAASLLLIVSLSILFLKKSTVDSDQSIALNNTKVKEENTPTPPDETTTISSGTTSETKPLETKEKEDATNSNFKKQVSTDGKAVTSTLKEAEQSQKNLEGLAGKSRQANNSTNDMVVAGNGIVSESVVTKQDKAGDFETLETADNSKKVLADEVASVPASAKNEESANVTVAYEKSAKYKDALKKEASKQQPVTAATGAAENKTVAGNADGDKMETDTKAYTTIAQNTSSTKPVQTVPAYFTGNEAAIKEYILTYHKKINSTQKLQGTFLIKTKVLSNGTLKVESINNVSKDYSDCKDFLKEALNSMKDWNPALKNGVKTDSDTQFMLMF
jgi:hypothetical protein